DVAPLALAHALGRVEQQRPRHPDEGLVGGVVVLAGLDLAPGGVRHPGPPGRLVLRQPEAAAVLADVLAHRHPVDPVRLLALRRYRHDPSLPSLTLMRSACRSCLKVLASTSIPAHFGDRGAALP